MQQLFRVTTDHPQTPQNCSLLRGCTRWEYAARAVELGADAEIGIPKSRRGDLRGVKQSTLQKLPTTGTSLFAAYSQLSWMSQLNP